MIAGERGAVIGRDANGTIIVTGDGNLVFAFPGVTELSVEVVKAIKRGELKPGNIEGAVPVPGPDLFVSYSRDDAVWVSDFAMRMKVRENVRLWLDLWDIKPGDDWMENIELGIRVSRGCIICIGSKRPGYWQKKEIEIALVEAKERENFLLIPVIVPGGSNTFIPPMLRGKHYIDFNLINDIDLGITEIAHATQKRQIKTDIESEHRFVRRKEIENTLSEFQRIKNLGLHEQVIIAIESRLVQEWIEISREFYRSKKDSEFTLTTEEARAFVSNNG